MLNRCFHLHAVYRISRKVTLFRTLLIRQRQSCFVRSVHSQNAPKIQLEDLENLQLREDRKLYENTYSSRLWRLHGYSLVFLITLSYSAVSLFLVLKPAKEKRETNSWAINYLLKAHEFLCKWKLVFCGVLFSFGIAQFAGMTTFIKRNVHSIVLLKNGREVIIRTYGRTPVLRQLIVHRKQLSEVSCLTGRNEKVSNLYLAMSGCKHKLYIDKNGRFYSPELFDITVGVMRKLKE